MTFILNKLKIKKNKKNTAIIFHVCSRVSSYFSPCLDLFGLNIPCIVHIWNRGWLSLNCFHLFRQNVIVKTKCIQFGIFMMKKIRQQNTVEMKGYKKKVRAERGIGNCNCVIFHLVKNPLVLIKNNIKKIYIYIYKFPIVVRFFFFSVFTFFRFFKSFIWEKINIAVVGNVPSKNFFTFS